LNHILSCDFNMIAISPLQSPTLGFKFLYRRRLCRLLHPSKGRATNYAKSNTFFDILPQKAKVGTIVATS